ncbi:unnamed protein product [Phytophthora lilii]|uniref:Unnamed protein product n=1 Tax=Phytophthora lilii TaxID=2077276 RepID=A0A9W6TB25_9STRA|nr:unnamed protein product [Phytophthora lilii]
MGAAAGSGHLEIVEWLRSELCTVKAMDGAVRGSHFEVVKWLHWNRCEGCSSRALECAVTIAISRWQNGCSRMIPSRTHSQCSRRMAFSYCEDAGTYWSKQTILHYTIEAITDGQFEMALFVYAAYQQRTTPDQALADVKKKLIAVEYTEVTTTYVNGPASCNS